MSNKSEILVQTKNKITIDHLLKGVSFRAEIDNYYPKDNFKKVFEWSAKIDITKNRLYLCKIDHAQHDALESYVVYVHDLITGERYGGNDAELEIHDYMDNKNRTPMPKYEVVRSCMRFKDMYNYFNNVHKVIRQIIIDSGLIENITHVIKTEELMLESLVNMSYPTYLPSKL